MTKEKEPAGVVTAQQIEKWKAQYGRIYTYTADGKVGYLRAPDRRIIASAAVLAGPDNLKQKEMVIANCWLGGDADLKDRDNYFFGLSNVVDGIIDVVQGELKEL